MQIQVTPSLFSELSVDQAQTLWVTLCNASLHARRRGLGEDFSQDIGVLAEEIEKEFDDVLFDDFEICDGPGGDAYLAPWLPGYSGLDKSAAVFSATAGLR